MLNKKSIIVISILIIVFLFVGYISSVLNPDKESSKTASFNIEEEQRRELPPESLETEVAATSPTGALILKKSEEEIESDTQFSNLRQVLPLDTTSFSLSKFNFDTFKITVTFKPGFSGNKQQTLNKWLEDNGYGKIDRNYFEIR